tara:strand:- start:90845 stop:91600 length:756 start_codon:yes stop_codon:yes gene_type:complete
MIEVSNLSIHIGSRKLVEDFNASFNKGEIVFILGKNGIGKSTFLNCLIRRQSYSGSISLFNQKLEVIDSKELFQKIAHISQKSISNLNISLCEFFNYSRYPWKLYPSALLSDEKEKLNKLMEKFDFKIPLDRLLATLSGGELQKALLIGAFLQDTDFILLDEALAWLDPHQKIELLDLISKQAKIENKGIIAITHDINQSLFYGDRIVLAKDSGWEVLKKKEVTPEIINSIYNYNFQIVAGDNDFFIKGHK